MIPPKGSIPRLTLAISAGAVNRTSRSVQHGGEKRFHVHSPDPALLKQRDLLAKALAERTAFWESELAWLRQEFSEERLIKIVEMVQRVIH